KEDLEAKGRETLEHALKAQNLPYRKLAGSAVLAGVIRETGFKKAEEFYVARGAVASQTYGINVIGVEDVLVRLAKCCTPVPGDPIVGYISLGRGITIHREDCPNARALMRNPERFTAVSWDADGQSAFRVEIQVDGWDRHRLLEDMSRTFAEAGINIIA